VNRLSIDVVGPQGRRHLSLPAEVPLVELLPSLVQMIGAPATDSQAEPSGWLLAPPTGNALPEEVSLSASGVLPGSVLYLYRAEFAANASSGLAPSVLAQIRDPLERTQAALPSRLDPWRRLRASLKATKRAIPIEQSEVELDLRQPPRPAAFAAAPASSRWRAARTAWSSLGYRQQLEASIVGPRLRRSVAIAVISPKGGVGKTTVTALLGTLMAHLRRDRVIAVDTNPDFGSLGRVLTPDHQVYADDLLADLEHPMTLTQLDARLGRGPHGLMILPAPTDPDRMTKLGEDAYRTIIGHLKEIAGMVFMDCGTGLQDPAARAAIASADQVLVICDAEPATASLVTEAGRYLTWRKLRFMVVVNKFPRRGTRLNLRRLAAHMPDADGMAVIPKATGAAARLTGGEFEWGTAPRGWQISCRELGVTLASGWPALGLTL
jgi:MinD-like ATPase involved in chromosome partitioning or flagellar assembly